MSCWRQDARGLISTSSAPATLWRAEWNPLCHIGKTVAPMIRDVDIEPLEGLPANRGAGDPQVGEIWAWRSGNGPIVGVAVLQWGLRRATPRTAVVKVRFPDQQLCSEGWVQPSRLLSRWDELSAYQALQAQWDRVSASNPSTDSIEEHAAYVVFGQLIPARVAEVGSEPGRGPLLYVHDSKRLAELTGLQEGVWAGCPNGFQMPGGPFIAPWTVTLLVAQEAAKRDPMPVMDLVAIWEEDAREEATNGRWTVPPDGIPTLARDPRDAEEDDLSWPGGRPMREALRRWCDSDQAVPRGDLLSAARSDLVRIRKAAWQAVTAMTAAGLAGPAETLINALTNLDWEGDSCATPSERHDSALLLREDGEQ